MLMLVGAGAYRTRLLDELAIRKITDFVLMVVTPCLIITAFQRPFDRSMLPGLGWAFFGGAIGHTTGIILARLLLRDADDRRQRVMRFATVFSNAGFMGLPLEYAILGNDGVFFGIAYVAMFNLFCWTYGVWEIGVAGNGWRRMVINPGTVGLAIGLALFFMPWRLPEVIASPIAMIGAMNTPLPMIVIGFQLAGAAFLPAFRFRKTYLMLACRHFLVPLAVLGVMMCLPSVNRTVRLVTVIAASCPIGVLLTMFTLKARGDLDYATALVSLSTLISVITLPLMVGIARGLL